jgi:hypothetical protein
MLIYYSIKLLDTVVCKNITKQSFSKQVFPLFLSEGTMRESNSYLAAIHRHLWSELTPGFEDLPVPGPEAYSLPGGGVP